MWQTSDYTNNKIWGVIRYTNWFFETYLKIYKEENDKS